LIVLTFFFNCKSQHVPSALQEEFNKGVKETLAAMKGEAKAELAASTSKIPRQTEVSAKVNRLVDWNVDVLKKLLKVR
jgi:hypothetical protein